MESAGTVPQPLSNLVEFDGSICYTYFDNGINTYVMPCSGPSPDGGTLGAKPGSSIHLFQDALYFTWGEPGADTVQHGWELWRTDLAGQSTLIKDINFGGNANPILLGEANGWLYFAADNGLDGYGIWKTDGTADGTTRVHDFSTDEGVVQTFRGLGNAGGKVMFSVQGGTSLEDGLWSAGGPGDVVLRIGTLPSEDYFVWTEYGGKMYYSAQDEFAGIEVFVTDGTSGSVYKDIPPAAHTSLPLAMGPCGARLCITANDWQHGEELWTTSGDPTDMSLLADLNTRPVGSNPKDFTRAGDYIFFHADDGVIPANIWRTDGTPEGTIALNFSTDIQTIEKYVIGSDLLYPVEDRVFFTVFDIDHGRELWVSDESAEGIYRVKDIVPGPDSTSFSKMTALEDQLFFVANDGFGNEELWVSDGSETGTYMVKDLIPPEKYGHQVIGGLTPLNDKMLFERYDFDTKTADLFKTDGTADGTEFITTVPQPWGFLQGDGVVFIPVFLDSINQFRLYQTDGTAAGTVEVADLGSGIFVREMKAMSGDVYIFVSTSEGLKLWVYHADEDLLVLLHTFYDPNFPDPTPYESATGNGKLVFSVNEYDAYYGYDTAHLWVSDGTVAGTQHITGNFKNPAKLQSAGKGFIFNADSGAEGREVWKTDGTQAGTVQ
ncbi:MAG TPA: hypothetical protein PJ988_09145, partial [Anaerolinea sp.]|nr:hypothetical protein [Anaerolinea sp.]